MLVATDKPFGLSISGVMKGHQQPFPESRSLLCERDRMRRQSRMSRKTKNFTIMRGRHVANPGELAANLAAQLIDGIALPKSATSDGNKARFRNKKL
jgi:hypothetical protein